MRNPDLIDIHIHSSLTEINGHWYLAKPCQYSGIEGIIERLYHAWFVLRGKAIAVRFKEQIKGE